MRVSFLSSLSRDVRSTGIEIDHRNNGLYDLQGFSAQLIPPPIRLGDQSVISPAGTLRVIVRGPSVMIPGGDQRVMIPAGDQRGTAVSIGPLLFPSTVLSMR